MAEFYQPKSLFLQAGSSEELVAQLRGLSQLPASMSLPEFMNRFASRFEQLSPGRKVRIDSPDHFIADLMKYGWVKLPGDP